MFSGLWEAAKNSPFKRTVEAHCDAPEKQLVAGRTISAADAGEELWETDAQTEKVQERQQTEVHVHWE